MTSQKIPNAWSCLPTAFAMAIGCSVQSFIEEIGHDGSEIVWPDNPEPMCHRGFCFQECILVLLKMGLTATEVSRDVGHYPSIASIDIVVSFHEAFDYYLKSTKGVVAGRTSRCGHAVAYDHGTYNSYDFTPETLWIIK